MKYLELLYKHLWNTRIFPSTKISYLHCVQWRYYFYLSRVRILVLPRLLKRSPLLWLHNPLKSNLMCYYMIETPSVLPWKSSVMFGNLGRFSENVWKWLSGLRTTFWEFLEIFGKCLEIFGKSSKKSSLVSLYNKQNITRPLVLWILYLLMFNSKSHEWAQ